jgi:hypothetical protein
VREKENEGWRRRLRQNKVFKKFKQKSTHLQILDSTR